MVAAFVEGTTWTARSLVVTTANGLLTPKRPAKSVARITMPGDGAGTLSCPLQTPFEKLPLAAGVIVTGAPLRAAKAARETFPEKFDTTLPSMFRALIIALNGTPENCAPG